MGSMANPKTWVPIPYTNIRDCSQGFCTLYCPQWCYIVFPPPPPPPPPAVLFPDHDSGPKLSPLVIAIIGILASAVLLVSYYALISKYCGSSSDAEPRRRIVENWGDPSMRIDDYHDPSVHAAWQVETIGLDESVIRSITVCRYKKGVGLIEGTCPVCLSEFEENESIRLLPKCTHAFHIPCIDTWLKSHSSCPLCRSDIVFIGTFPIASPLPLEREVPHPPLPIDGSTVEVREANDGEKEEDITAVTIPICKSPLRVWSDLGNTRDTVIEIEEDRMQRVRRSVSMDHSRQFKFLTSDLMGLNRNDNTRAGHLDFGGSSQNPLCLCHWKMAPTKMKRSFSSDRLPINGHGTLRGLMIPE